MTDTGWINARNLALLRVGQIAVAAYLLLTTALYAYIDYAYPDENVFYGIAGFIAWAGGYLLLVRLMQQGHAFHDGMKAGVGSYFALSFVLSLFIGLGLVALLVPGLYLLMRWLPAYSRVVASDDGVGNSMRWSWHNTEPIQGMLARQMLGPIACWLLVVAILLHWEFVYWPGEEYSLAYELVTSILINLLSGISAVWLTILGIATYELIMESSQTDA